MFRAAPVAAASEKALTDSSDEDDYERIEADETEDTHKGRCGYLAPGEKLTCSCERNDIGDIVEMKAACTVHDFMARRDYEYVSNSEEDEGSDVDKKIAALKAALAKASADNGRLAKTNKLWSAVSIGSIVWIAYLLYLIRAPQACPPRPLVICNPRPPCPAPEHCPVAKACPLCYDPPRLGAEQNRSGVWPRFDIMDHFIYSVRDGEHGGYDYANVEKGEEILTINGVDVRDKKEDEIRDMLATAQSKNSGGRLHLTTRTNWFKFNGVVSAYKRGWKECSERAREGSENVWYWIAVVAASLAGVALLVAFAYFSQKDTAGANKIKASDKPPPVVEKVQVDEASHEVKKVARESGADSVEQPPVNKDAHGDEISNNEDREAKEGADSVEQHSVDTRDDEMSNNDNRDARRGVDSVKVDTATNTTSAISINTKTNNQDDLPPLFLFLVVLSPFLFIVFVL